MYQFQYVIITHPGKKRANNEDNFYIDGKWKSDIEKKTMKVSGNVKSGKLLAAVFDGMGGSAKGERASYLAAEQIAAYDEMIQEGKAPRLRDDEMYYVSKANHSICREMKNSGEGMGTTFASLEFANGTVMAENIGDSRIYRVRSGKLERLSTDHTMIARMIRMKQITEEEAKKHHMNHRITQYLGIPEEEMYLEPAVTKELPINAEDKFLICSDGLTDMLSDSEIEEIMCRGSSVDAIAEQLVQDALAAGGKDNITVCVINVMREKSQGIKVKRIAVIIFAVIISALMIFAGMKYKSNEEKSEEVETTDEEDKENLDLKEEQEE